MKKACLAADSIGAFAIEVVAKTPEAKRFYEKFGFRRLEDDAFHLYSRAPSCESRRLHGSVANPTWDRWLDAAAFKEAELGTFGDSGVGILRGPGFWNVDLGVDKSIGLGGSRALVLKVEAFNVFNHSNKGMPNRDWSNKAQFGTIHGHGQRGACPRVCAEVPVLTFVTEGGRAA